MNNIRSMIHFWIQMQRFHPIPGSRMTHCFGKWPTPCKKSQNMMCFSDMSTDVLHLHGVLFFVSKTLNEQDKRMSSLSLSLSGMWQCHMQFISPSNGILNVMFCWVMKFKFCWLFKYRTFNFCHSVKIPTELRVKKWAISFFNLVKDELGLREFEDFLRKEYSLENIRFWKEVEDMKNGPRSAIETRVEEICRSTFTCVLIGDNTRSIQRWTDFVLCCFGWDMLK